MEFIWNIPNITKLSLVPAMCYTLWSHKPTSTVSSATHIFLLPLTVWRKMNKTSLEVKICISRPTTCFTPLFLNYYSKIWGSVCHGSQEGQLCPSLFVIWFIARLFFLKTKFKLILIIPPLLLYLILFLFSPLPNEINQLVFLFHTAPNQHPPAPVLFQNASVKLGQRGHCILKVFEVSVKLHFWHSSKDPLYLANTG